tara:strand:- start:1667 stop:1969 length:303 start_codon:yes stop_codon:yes gene_type:complete
MSASKEIVVDGIVYMVKPTPAPPKPKAHGLKVGMYVQVVDCRDDSRHPGRPRSRQIGKVYSATAKTVAVNFGTVSWAFYNDGAAGRMSLSPAISMLKKFS